MRFVKMEGLGNDFILVQTEVPFPADLVRRLCDRHHGIGADGVLAVWAGGTVGMRYWNADGSEPELCGNGLRCAARFAFDQGMASDAEFTVETLLGPRRVRVGEMVEVELGEVEVGEPFSFDGLEFRRVSVGNPHAVHVGGDPAAAPVASVGSRLERATEGGINVEFVEVLAGDRARMRVWERGVGETAACGTGMAAAVGMTRALGLTGDRVQVTVPGGVGSVGFRGRAAWLEGPARYVFTGDWPD